MVASTKSQERKEEESRKRKADCKIQKSEKVRCSMNHTFLG